MFLVSPAGGRRLSSWAWQGMGVRWRSCACCLLAVVPSIEALFLGVGQKEAISKKWLCSFADITDFFW